MIYPYWAILMSLPVTHGFYTHEYGLPVGTIPIRVRVWLFEFIKPMGITHGCTHGLLVVVPNIGYGDTREPGSSTRESGRV